MDLIQGLLSRVSAPRLEAPGPNEAQVELMMQAALRAPDHANLKPWRSIMVAGDAREKLGQVFQKAQQQRDADSGVTSDERTLDKCSKMPCRAPNVLVLIASPKQHPKVPEAEQIQTTAAAGHAMLLAAFAQNVGAVWRTGWVVAHPQVREALGVESHESIIGMIYLGTPTNPLKTAPQISSSNFITDWH